MSWSAEQLRMLRAMGHEPMLLAPPTGGAPSVAVLAAAIARAADGRDLSALALDLDRLRCEPALKRALWPRLRALRKQHR